MGVSDWGHAFAMRITAFGDMDLIRSAFDTPDFQNVLEETSSGNTVEISTKKQILWKNVVILIWLFGGAFQILKIFRFRKLISRELSVI